VTNTQVIQGDAGRRDGKPVVQERPLEQIDKVGAGEEKIVKAASPSIYLRQGDRGHWEDSKKHDQKLLRTKKRHFHSGRRKRKGVPHWGHRWKRVPGDEDSWFERKKGNWEGVQGE